MIALRFFEVLLQLLLIRRLLPNINLKNPKVLGLLFQLLQLLLPAKKLQKWVVISCWFQLVVLILHLLGEVFRAFHFLDFHLLG